MARLHHILIGAGLLVGAQLVHAQGTSDLSIPPNQPAPGTMAPAGTADTPADAPLYGPSSGTSMPERTAEPADSSGAAATGSGAAGAEAAAQPGSGLVVGTIIQTAPPTEAQSAAAMSNDPFVQRREARAQARKEYRERRQEAREQYREDRRAADSLLYQQSGQ